MTERPASSSVPFVRSAGTLRAEACIGWDVGGANLKAARVEGGRAVATLERPFEVWREPRGLAPALAAMARELGPAGTHVVTMTAELADCFQTKAEGVRAVLDALREALPSETLEVMASDGAFLTPEAAMREPLRVAAANWRAAAEWLASEWLATLWPATVWPASGPVTGGRARASGTGVLVDVGSTTTDLVPFVAGRVLAEAVTDPERLLAGELVYTGALRTPLAALLRTAPFRGRDCPVAAEHFAIAGDAHLWLGELEPREYTCPTPDGSPITREASRRRLARTICADAEMLSAEEITAIARAAREEQLSRIAGALARVAARTAERQAGWAEGGENAASSPGPPVVVVAGCGAWLAREAARRCGLEVGDLGAHLGPAARVLPALAAAALWQRRA